MNLDIIKDIFRQQTPEAPKVVTPPEINEKIAKQDIAKIQTEVFDNFLSEAKHIDISGELAQNEIVSVLGKNTQEFVTEKITDSQIKEVNQETSKNVEKVLENKSVLEKVRGLGHAAIITAIFTLGINSAFGANEKGGGLDKNKTEQGANKEKEPVFVLSATNFFETDKAELNNPAELVQKFDEFLSKINEQNFQEVLTQDWKAEGSSDERKTFNWDGKNVNLTKARNQTYINLLNETLKKHDFSSQLSEDHAKQILSKQIFSIYPAGGAEEGVTYLTDMVNDEGKKYTLDEIASLKPDELQKLYEKCRYTKFVAEIEIVNPATVNLDKIKPGNVELKINPSGKIELPEINNYDECYILIDSSPSMEFSRRNLAKELRRLNINKPVTICYFSEGLSSKMTTFKNGNDAADMLEKMPTGGNGIENALSSTIQALDEIHQGDQEKIKAGDKLPSRIIYFLTDEGIQDPYKLSELISKEGKDKVIGFVGSEKTAKFDMNGLRDVIKKNIENGIKSKIDYLESKIASVTASTEAREKIAIDNFLAGQMGEEKKAILAADGIVGSKEEMKNLLLTKNIDELKNIGSSDKYKYFVAERLKRQETKESQLKSAGTDQTAIDALKANLSEEAITKAMSDKNLQVTSFSDDSGKQIEVPVI